MYKLGPCVSCRYRRYTPRKAQIRAHKLCTRSTHTHNTNGGLPVSDTTAFYTISLFSIRHGHFNEGTIKTACTCHLKNPNHCNLMWDCAGPHDGQQRQDKRLEPAVHQQLSGPHDRRLQGQPECYWESSPCRHSQLHKHRGGAFTKTTIPLSLLAISCSEASYSSCVAPCLKVLEYLTLSAF